MNKITFEHLEHRERPDKTITSYAHEVAYLVCQWLGDRKEFGLWVKKARELGPGQMKAKLDDVKLRYTNTGDPKFKNSHYFLACLK